jgi:hypothetical protein
MRGRRLRRRAARHLPPWDGILCAFPACWTDHGRIMASLL